ncbi:alpha/beta fold hydrolase [Nigerium massiliense]|uniref:alpha/beta fold hydrolase n=1 Tax=Nigerium massiliense TaxID=1522317 RepID=UPI0006945D03|nr:alpha/beta hydrolase [Nigerium massiliense]
MATVTLTASGERSDLPLVLLAPFPLDSRVWEAVRKQLAGDIIAVDPPGFGGATTDADPSLENYAQTLLNALEDRGIDRFVVAGNSMGGYVALALADLVPQRLAGIGLVGTKASADDDAARTNRIDMAEKAEAGEDPAGLVAPMIDKVLAPATREKQAEIVRAVEGWLAEAPADGVAWCQRAMAARPDRTRVLKQLDIPAAVIHGSDDPLMDAGSQRDMAGALGVTVDTLEGRGHLLPVEAPREVAAILRDLWQRARRRG